jgi:hypothetical protein
MRILAVGFAVAVFAVATFALNSDWDGQDRRELLPWIVAFAGFVAVLVFSWLLAVRAIWRYVGLAVGRIRARDLALIAVSLSLIAVAPVERGWIAADGCNDAFGSVALIDAPHLVRGYLARPAFSYDGGQTLVGCGDGPGTPRWQRFDLAARSLLTVLLVAGIAVVIRRGRPREDLRATRRQLRGWLARTVFIAPD